jgi:hypothetical protein
MIIVCADVTNLYPSIPINIGISFMRNRLRYLKTQNKISLTYDEINFLCDLTKWTLQHNYIEFGNLHFKQIKGTAMGTPVAVVFANLFLQQLETIVFQTLKDEFPLFFKRYIDDILALFKNITHALKFIEIYNSIVESINLTSTMSHNSGVFLDLLIFIGPKFETQNTLDVKLYQKPQDKYLYLPQFSFHNKSIYRSFIDSELNRIRLNCSTDTDFMENKTLYFNRLIARDYSPSFLNPIFQIERNRVQLLSKINVRIENKRNSIEKPIKTSPFLFKTTFNQVTTQLNIKQCLQLTDDMKSDPHSKLIFADSEPIVCYKTSKKLGQILTTSRYNHTIADNKPKN